MHFYTLLLKMQNNIKSYLPAEKMAFRQSLLKKGLIINRQFYNGNCLLDGGSMAYISSNELKLSKHTPPIPLDVIPNSLNANKYSNVFNMIKKRIPKQILPDGTIYFSNMTFYPDGSLKIRQNVETNEKSYKLLWDGDDEQLKLIQTRLQTRLQSKGVDLIPTQVLINTWTNLPKVADIEPEILNPEINIVEKKNV